MAKLIQHGRELVRISDKNPSAIEYSTNGGRTWASRYSGSVAGMFLDLLSFGGEILAVTSKGVYYSTNDGRTWTPRYTANAAGEFIQLHADGGVLLATTSKGLYYSKNSGRSWARK